MGRGNKKRSQKNRKTRKTAPPNAVVAPPIKTKYVPPQPAQSYRDPIDTSSDEMTEDDCDSLTHLSLASSTSSRAHVETSITQPQSQNYFSGLENTQGTLPMDTDDLAAYPPDPHANKRKRADTNPDDQGTPPPAMRTPHLQTAFPTPPTNQLGLSTDSPDRHSQSASNSPANENNDQLSRLSIGPSLSTAALRNDTVPSPRYRNRPNQSPYLRTQPERPYPPTPPLNTHIADVEVTGFLGENPLIGINPPSAASWKTIGDLKALVYPHDASFSEEEKGVIAEQMVLAVAHHLNCHRPIVTAPKPAKDFENRKAGNRRPWVYMISGLAEENLDIILRDKFISNQHATLHVLPFDPPPSHYIGRIKNLTHDASKQDSVIRLIQRSIEEDPTVRGFMDEFIAEHNDNMPRSVMRKNHPTEWVINSVRAFHIQSEKKPGKPYSQWNWYIYTPTRIQDQVDSWIKTLATVQFDTIALGVGETITHLKCTRC